MNDEERLEQKFIEAIEQAAANPPDEQIAQWHHDALNWWSTRFAPRS